jgi:hypothetical protein
MRLYLDEDSASSLLVQLLRSAPGLTSSACGGAPPGDGSWYHRGMDPRNADEQNHDQNSSSRV